MEITQITIYPPGVNFQRFVVGEAGVQRIITSSYNAPLEVTVFCEKMFGATKNVWTVTFAGVPYVAICEEKADKTNQPRTT
jgi:hypothetical protein